MEIFTLLSISTGIADFSVEGIGVVDLGWLGYIISWIFNLFSGVPGAIALGTILFTLALKTITLPLDIYSRVKMRKMSLSMEQMRPQMEKLQKQYANDRNMYQQKVAELQRANGYNPLGACLPSIVTLAIFMTVFSSFSQYSQYANLTSYNNMTVAYSRAVNEYVLYENAPDEDKYFLIAAVEDGKNNPTTPQNAPRVIMDGDGNLKIVDEAGEVLKDGAGNELDFYGFYIDYDKFGAYYLSIADNLPQSWKEGEWADKNWQELSYAQKDAMVKAFVRIRAREAASDYYHAHSSENAFPTPDWWVGNVWYPDSMLNKEVPTFSDFRSTISRAAGNIDPNYEESYNEVTFNLQEEKNTYNGYFVLIVLAIGLMFLQQFITMRSQKAANELSSVDGEGAASNKMMMVVMPVIFGLLSFMYSAAFSIYMIVNTVYSLISTLIINKVVSVRFDKKREQMELDKAAGRAGRKRLK